MTLYPVIMAGGSGTRFWPLSRKAKPKQFLPLVSERALIADTADRLGALATLGETYVVCGPGHVKLVKQHLPGLPAAQLLVEPVARNTAPAIGLAALAIAKRDPDGVMVVLPSDHAVRDVKAFRKVLREAAGYAKAGALVTLGITPDRPETGYGYIHVGAKEPKGSGHGVKAFVEKPPLAVAKAYLKGKKHLWNAGIFVFKATAILAAMTDHLPELAEGLDALAPHLGKPSFTSRLATLFPEMPSISIDHGVMEKAQRIVVVPADIGWNDVGSFSALPDVLALDGAGNVARGTTLLVDTKGSVVLGGGRPIAVIGMENVVIVDAGDALLVCPKDRCQDVRQVVELLKARKLDALL